MAAPHEPRLATLAALLADASRARMLAVLLSGELASAGELARTAAVSAATASEHLGKLLVAGLVTCEPRGRHRYYRLADADVAHALEALAMVAERGTHARQWDTPARRRLRLARCCYGHLGGQLGVGLLSSWVERGWLVPSARVHHVSDAGAAALDRLGLDGRHWQRRAQGGGRPVAYGCIDWSERRDHLAGALAVALLQTLLDRGWLRRRAGERALLITAEGRRRLVDWMPLPDPAALTAG